MYHYNRMLTILLLVLTLTFTAFAGVMVVTKETDKTTGKVTMSTLYIDKQGIRVETGENVGADLVIFRKDKNSFWVIDTQKGTYMEITKSDIEKMNSMIDHQMKMMEEQIKNLPPAQQEMMKKHMQQMMGVGETPKEEYKKVKSGVKVNQWVCDVYEGFQDGAKFEEIYTVDWGSVGISKEDLLPFKEMEEFFSSMHSRNKGKGKGSRFDFGFEDEGYEGVPVKEVYYDGGQVQSITEVVKITRQDFSADLFNLPKGLKKAENPFQEMETPQQWK
ncbi:MAG: DUF4412 domain-containing protein [Calditrichaeota bacterium]|nr:MAG: DUF4412 domain-containing protein [Calditrichota bacterium]